MQDCTAILAIQAFDLAVDDLESRIRQLKEKGLKMEREVGEEETLLRRKEALQKKILLRRREAESEAASLTEKIGGNELRLKTAGMTPNAYMATQRELERNKELLGSVESRVLEDMEKLEVLEKDIEKAAKLLAGRKQHLDDVKKRLAGEIAELEREADLQRTQRRQASLKLPAVDLELYEEIRRKTKGRAIWDADKSGCPSCGMSLSAGFINAMAGTNRAEPCPHCNVLIRWVGIVDGVR
ncbi:MAG TPA: hypothetical protein PLU72_05015 [Candidatus Ozemobacteraceae bacterium]|nr:hypothetical protein [Candidatus Ozemobacteraceae bacterium]